MGINYIAFFSLYCKYIIFIALIHREDAAIRSRSGADEAGERSERTGKLPPAGRVYIYHPEERVLAGRALGTGPWAHTRGLARS